MQVVVRPTAVRDLIADITSRHMGRKKPQILDRLHSMLTFCNIAYGVENIVFSSGDIEEIIAALED